MNRFANSTFWGASFIAAALLVGGCHHRHPKNTNTTSNSAALDQASQQGPQADTMATTTAASTAMCFIKPSAASATQPSQGQVMGRLTMTQTADGVKIVGNLQGLPPNTKHGFHIHDKGDLSAADLSSAGGHFDPTGTHHHGGPGDAEAHHAGDLGNIESDANGNAHIDVTAMGVSLDGPHGIVGKSIIIHAKADDLKSQPAGDAGARIAGGVIEAK